MPRYKYFEQGISGRLWDRYRKAQNHVTKLKAASMNAYLPEKCNSDAFRNNPSDYWQTIKPFDWQDNVHWSKYNETMGLLGHSCQFVYLTTGSSIFQFNVNIAICQQWPTGSWFYVS